MKRNVLSALLIGAGVFIIAFPSIVETYHDRQQQALIQEWQNAFETIKNVEDSSLEPSEAVTPLRDDAAGTTVSDAPASKRERVPLSENMVGLLHVDKIDLKLPILKGANPENLRTTAASIENTGNIGEIGNFAVAGHRNRTFGRNFNRLDELAPGDAIDVDNGKETFRYQVTEKLYVEPHEVWVLEPKGTEREITLVTCHPVDTGTHRLIIKGKIIEKVQYGVEIAS
ncbi:class D sortase [Paenibacillus silviterrae]|uniref:class D sortase n=1 Tax=Paenibacillus silviterrae TaxID=3242194 RepID=UPI002543E94E|nr:class D sortase [Paenibacillus chinjuensis]